MRKLDAKEMKIVNGGAKWKCSYCGYTTKKNSLKMALHFGLKPWHSWAGGKIVEVK